MKFVTSSKFFFQRTPDRLSLDHVSGSSNRDPFSGLPVFVQTSQAAPAIRPTDEKISLIRIFLKLNKHNFVHLYSIQIHWRRSQQEERLCEKVSCNVFTFNIVCFVADCVYNAFPCYYSHVLLDSLVSQMIDHYQPDIFWWLVSVR